MAGLLDNLFNPSLYSGQNGGLLDFLRNTQMQQNTYQPSGGFAPMLPPQPEQAAQPIQVGGIQMPRIGDAARFDPSIMNAMAQAPGAQPAQGQAPQPLHQPQPMQQPDIGFGDRIGAGLMNFANAGGLLPALAGGLDGLMTGHRSDRVGNANQTAQFLVSKGIDPALAKSIVSDPATLRSVLPSLIGTGGQTDDIKEYNFARQQEPNLTFQQFMQRKRAVSGEYSLTPQYGTDKDGNTVLIQTGKSGEAIQTKLPPGVKISSGVEKVDLGTSWGLIDKRTGNLVGTQAKDVAGKEAAEARGKAQGEAQAKLPAVIIDAEETTKKIDQLLSNDGLDSIVGAVDQFRPSWTLGSSGRDALARLEQLQGGAFLQAFNTLKGGGAITEVEGQKAERAIARMQRSQSEADFRAALMDFRDAVSTGVRKLRASAGETGSYPAGIVNAQPSASPKASHDLKKKYGLD